MSYQIERIAFFLVAPPGQPMEVALIKRRSDAKLKEFQRDFPIVKELKASVLQLQSEATDKGLIQHICLQSNHQYLLPFAGGAFSANGEADAFLREVASLRKAVEGAPFQVFLASSPGVDPASHPDIADKRQSAKDNMRVDRTQFLHTGQFGLEQEMPMVQPRGQALVITVQVKRLERSSAKVKVLDTQSGLSISGDKYQLRGRNLTLRRIGTHKSSDSGQKLQFAMDTLQELKLSVTLAVNWQSGTPAYLEFNDFM